MDWSPPSCSGVDGGDVVKVEIWDVVDKAKHTPQNSANRISTADLKYNLKEDGKCIVFMVCMRIGTNGHIALKYRYRKASTP